MNSTTLIHADGMGRSDFIELLSAEFTCAKGYGVHAFLSYHDIDTLYHVFLDGEAPATAFVRQFVRRFR